MGITILRNWHVRFTEHGPDGNGRQVRINLKTPDQREALEKASSIYIGHTKDPSSAAPTVPLTRFLQEYRSHLLANKAQKTCQNEWLVLRSFFDAVVPDLQRATLRDITTGMITSYIDRRRIQDGISEKTAYHIRQALHTLFNYAIRNKNFPFNPARDVLKPKVRMSGEIIYLRKPEIENLLQALREHDPLLFGPVATAILAGLRRSEILWLTWEDVDLARRRLHIRFKTVEGVLYKPKTKRPRMVPISDDLLPILERLPRRSELWVFPTPEGHRWNPDNLSHRLKNFADTHGMGNRGFLVFRHTFGSQLAQKGLSLYKISALMGNSERICREHYAALAVEDLQPEIAFLGSDRLPASLTR